MGTVRSFEGRHALVTGAASGIGKATALELARRGARVALADIDDEGARATADAVRQLGRRKDQVSTHRVDMAEQEEVDALAASLGEALVREFARAGATITLVARRKGRLEEIAAQLGTPTFRSWSCGLRSRRERGQLNAGSPLALLGQIQFTIPAPGGRCGS